LYWDFLGWAFLVLFGFFSLSTKVTCWSYISPKLGLGSHRVENLRPTYWHEISTFLSLLLW
jgi:hypothetical protein